ncbi:discoidin domain-containing protein [Nocardia sp. NPDC050710]|uniref:discoidin domain-containing protein n=1 Tax=Nocardia sp. NPDC050710 TaxID=3157220 RepID=UPI0033DDCF7F
MSGADPGDVFLHHRVAILDALLADPAFASSGAGADPEFGDAATGWSAAMPGPDSMPSGPQVRRRAAGPKASDRINALLNGHATEADPPADFSSEFAEAVTRNTEATGSKSEAPPAAERPDRKSAPDLLTRLKQPKVALAIAGVCVVLLVLVLVLTGGEDQKPQDRVLVITATPTAAATAPPTSAAPVAKTLQVQSAVANCPPGSTAGMDAFGGQQGKAWSCVRAYKIDGQILTIDLGKSQQIDSIGIVPGWDHIDADGQDQWTKYRTVRRVSYQFDDSAATTYTQQTMDQRTLVVTKIDPPVTASKIVLTVLESKGAPSINTTAISSIVITGR